MKFYGDSLTGTKAVGTVAKKAIGSFPPFSSYNNEPLGSVIVPVDYKGITISGLREGIPYYFRVAAVTDKGIGDYGYSMVPYSVPSSLKPIEPESVSISLVSDTSIKVSPI